MVSGVDLIPETWIIFFRARGSLGPGCWVISTVVYTSVSLSWYSVNGADS
jgi:hypothetical protein